MLPHKSDTALGLALAKRLPAVAGDVRHLARLDRQVVEAVGDCIEQRGLAGAASSETGMSISVIETSN